MLNDRYELQDRLGAGGMAKVFRAFDHSLSRTVAVKMLHDDLVSNEELRQRFLREARVFAHLRHPHIIEIHDVVHGEQSAAMVMEFIDGTDLSHLAKRQPLRVPELAVAVLRPVMDALSHAHAEGVIHRDVKPANIMLSRDGRVKLGDFGIAKVLDETHLTHTGEFLGTPAYIAPEQARGETVTAAVDQYALGVVLYELLAGRPPYTGPTPLAVLSQILIGKFPDIRELNEAVDERLAAVLHRTLNADPAARFPDVAALMAALDALVPPLPGTRERQLVAGLVADPGGDRGVGRPGRRRGLPDDGPPRAGPGRCDPGPHLRPPGARAPPNTPRTTPRPRRCSTRCGSPWGRSWRCRAPQPAARPSRSTPPPRSRRLPVEARPGRRRGGPAHRRAAVDSVPRAAPAARSPRPSPRPPHNRRRARRWPRSRRARSRRRRPRPPPAPPTAPSLATARFEPERRRLRARRRAPTRRRARSRCPSSPPPPSRPRPPCRTGQRGPARVGHLRLVTQPWADVEIDGKRVGRTPYLPDAELTPGPHRLVLRNPGLPVHEETIRIEAGQTLQRRVNLMSAGRPAVMPTPRRSRS